MEVVMRCWHICTDTHLNRPFYHASLDRGGGECINNDALRHRR